MAELSSGLARRISPCWAILKAGSGDDRPCSSRSWKAVSCSRLTFFSSLLHCFSRLFLTALLRWSSSQSLRAASYIFIWSANSPSTKFRSDSWKTARSRERNNSVTPETMYVLEVNVLFTNVVHTSAPRGKLCTSSLNAAPTRLRICGGFSPGSSG